MMEAASPSALPGSSNPTFEKAFLGIQGASPVVAETKPIAGPPVSAMSAPSATAVSPALRINGLTRLPFVYSPGDST
jgi:hypothetical protein